MSEHLTNMTGERFRCVLVGEGTLLLHCGETLLRRSHDIVSIIAPHADAARWAAARGIAHANSTDALAVAMRGRDIDYLFSVVNYTILSDEVVSLARRGAINYHDAPLPRYAGVNATSWAILAGETCHAVTWHEITTQVDAGRILKQHSVEIADTDTAFTLNTKCYEAAVASFGALVAELETETVVPRVQDLAQRSYFPRDKRPAAACIIEWEQPAARIGALGRALDFGSYHNPLGRPKLFLGETIVICGAVTPLPEVATVPPGTIVRIDDDAVVIAAQDRLVRVGALTTLDGVPVAISDIAAIANLTAGARLPSLTPGNAEQLTAVHKRACRGEAFWEPRLTELRPPVVPWVPFEDVAAGRRRLDVAVTIPGAMHAMAGGDSTAWLAGTFSAYLARLEAAEAFDIGIELPQTDRELAAVANTLFVRQLPMRLSVDETHPLPTVARLVRAELETIVRHGPFARDLFARLRPAASDAPRPWAHGLPVSIRVGELRLESEALSEAMVTFVISVDGQQAWLSFDPAFVPLAAAERMARHLETMLQHVCKDPTCAVGALPLLTRAECIELDGWNGTTRMFDDVEISTLHGLIARQAMRTPDVVAVECDGDHITYADLEVQSNRLANVLIARGVTAGDLIGVCVERSVAMMVALLGIMKSGAAYLPLDPEYPQDRLALMLSDSDVRTIVAQAHLRDVLPAFTGNVVAVEVRDDATLPALPPDRLIAAERLAYLIYTSGSTGVPKGAMLPHRAVVNYLRGMQETYSLSASDAVLQKAPISFDASVLELYWPLIAGARLVLARPGGHRDPSYLVATIESRQVTVLQFVPSLLAAMLGSSGFARACHDVRLLFLGGEALPMELAVRACAALPNAAVHNLYGPTEAAVYATAYSVADHLDPAVATVPIGQPMANVQVHVLSRIGMARMPVGVAGELYIGGAGVGAGYLGRAELTADRFVPDPFRPDPGARLYRTGDLARWRADGVLEFLGRADQQVKIRGFRVELGEIEAALAKYAGIRECVVTAHGEGPRARLVAYYVAAGETGVDQTAMRLALADALPEYMVPSVFVRLEQLPLGVTGKLDRRALPAPEDVGVTRPYLAPRTPLEAHIATVWSDVLSLDRVGIDDDFLALGGNSLLAMQVLARIGDEQAISLPLRTIFDAPTVEQLAAHVAERVRSPAHVDSSTVSPIPVLGRDEGPLSFAQELLWLLDRMHPGLAAYNLSEVLRIHGPVDVAALEGALTDLVQRHPALRTSFVAYEQGAMQRIVSTATMPLAIADLRHGSDDARNDEALRLVRGMVQHQFDLSTAPLMRALLVRLDEEEWVLALVQHHIVSDGWSRSVALREVGAFYASRVTGISPVLASLPLSYADYATWQREHVRGETLDALMHYWREQLDGAPDVLELPTDRPHPPVQGFTGATRHVVWDAALLERVKRVGQEQGATLFMTLLAAFQAVLSRYSGQEDFVVGTPVAGRTRRETEGLVGYFANMLPLRANLRDDPSFAELLGRVRTTCLGAFEHQEIPFEALVQELGGQVNPSHAPIFQVMFALQNTAPAELHLVGAAVTRDDAESEVSKYDLWVTATEQGDDLQIAAEFRTDLFDASTIDRLLGHMRTFLTAAVRSPAQRVSTFPLLDEVEQRQLHRWNATDLVLPRSDQPLHVLIAGQAARTPEAVAIVSDTEQLTYRALDTRANQLAHHLITLGVAPGELVGICVERSADLLVGLLGIMKAGAAYVPLDPGYPPDRLALMLGDSAIRVMVAQAQVVHTLPAFAGSFVLIDADRTAIDGRPTTAPPIDLDRDALAYVIYTSGSTGVPKGAMLSHRAVVNYLLWMQHAYTLDTTDGVLQKAPVSFDASVWELYLPLIAGARLVLARPDGHRDPMYLLGTIATQRVTIVQFVPSLLGAMIETPGFATACARVRLLILGGEALPSELAARVVAMLPRAAVYNLYGPTEAAVYATEWAVTEAYTAGTVPIGKPITNVQVHILSRQNGQELMPIGVPGELYIGGAGVGSGYLNREQLTAERFVPDPFRDDPRARLYRTGDLARWRSDGALEFLGRADEQVKIRGFRVELGEIESALARHPGVRECAVAVRTATSGESYLVGYIVPRDTGVPPAGELRTWIGATLPEYMVPTGFVALDALPLGVTGKLDRRALPEYTSVATERPYVAPRTPMEQTVAEAWTDILGRLRVGIDEEFFELGGHSLLAMRIMLRLNGIFQVQLPLRVLFESRTVAALSDAIERELAQHDETSDIERMLAELEQLSDDEARHLLDKRSSELPL